MKNLRVIDKEKIETIINAGKDAKIYAARRLPIVAVCEMAFAETDNDVLKIIFERFEAEKSTEEVVEACRRLSVVKNQRIREFVVRIAPIPIVCEMAVIETYNNVLQTIIERLEKEKDTEEVIGALKKISNAQSSKIRKFVTRVAPIPVLYEMAVSEMDNGVLETIIERLEKEKDTEEAICARKKLSKALAWRGREFVAKIAPISLVCEMAVFECDSDVLKIIHERLEKEKDTEEVIVKCGKMSKSQNQSVRAFVSKIAQVYVLLNMAVEEGDNEVLETIIKRLEIQKDTEEVLGECEKLSKAVAWRVREFVARIAPISLVCEMAANEENEDVVKVIIQRLEREKDTEEVICVCKKLSRAQNCDIREFVAAIAPINVVFDMAVSEGNYFVLKIILKRLESTKDTEEAICACKKLSKAVAWRVREFVARIAPISLVCEMAANEENKDVVKAILERLKPVKDTEEVIGIYKKLFKTEDWRVRIFVVNMAPINVVLEIALTEKNEDVVEIILERLKPVKDTEEVRIIYNRIIKYSRNSYEHYINLSTDELIEVVEAEGDEAILKLVDEMS